MDDFSRFIIENIVHFNNVQGIISDNKFTWKDKFDNVEFEIKGVIKIKRLKPKHNND